MWNQADSGTASLQIEEIKLCSSAERKLSKQDSKGELSKLGGMRKKENITDRARQSFQIFFFFFFKCKIGSAALRTKPELI